MAFDLMVLGVIALGALLGAWKGFAWQLGAILAPLAGVAAAWPLSPLLAADLRLRPPLDRGAAFALIYLAVTLAVHLAARALRRRLDRAGLDGWDRHLGLLLGAAKGVVLAVALALGAAAVSEEARARIPETRTGAWMALALRAARPAAAPLLDPCLRLLEPPQRRNA